MPGLSGKLLPADGGEDGSRTHDLLNAIQTLSQLSYNPKLSLVSLQIIEGMTVLSLIRRQLYWCMRREPPPQVLSDIPALGPGRVYFFVSPRIQWCPRPDSNRYAFQHLILSQTSLPISSLGHMVDPTGLEPVTSSLQG